MELLERNGRRRRLTPAGAELVARTEWMLRELEAAEAALARTSTQVAGVLRAAAFPSAHRALLPPAIGTCPSSTRDLRVTTRDLEPEDSMPPLRLGGSTSRSPRSTRSRPRPPTRRSSAPSCSTIR